LIAIITVIEILKGTIYTNFTSMGSNTFNIASQSFISKNSGSGKRKRGNQNEEQNRIKLSEAEYFRDNFAYPSTVSITVMATNSAVIKREKKKSNPNIFVLGADANYLTVSGSSLAAGRNFNTLDVSSGENTCILGNSLASNYFRDAEDAVNSFISIGDARYRVLGVMDSKGSSFVDRTDNMIIIPLTNARQRFNVSQKSYMISILINDIKLMEIATDEAEGLMRKTRRLGAAYENNFSINKNDEVATSLIDNLKFVTMAASVIGLITLLGAAIGLMNIMLVSVAERTREIGVTKAIGANSRTIRLQFLTEAVIISMSGGAIGIVTGIMIGNILSLVFKSPFVIPWIWIAIGMSICLIVGLLAGIYPALKAGKLNPINALRYE